MLGEERGRADVNEMETLQGDLREAEPKGKRGGEGGKDPARLFPPGPPFLKLTRMSKGLNTKSKEDSEGLSQFWLPNYSLSSGSVPQQARPLQIWTTPPFPPSSTTLTL